MFVGKKFPLQHSGASKKDVITAAEEELNRKHFKEESSFKTGAIKSLPGCLLESLPGKQKTPVSKERILYRDKFG